MPKKQQAEKPAEPLSEPKDTTEQDTRKIVSPLKLEPIINTKPLLDEPEQDKR